MKNVQKNHEWVVNQEVGERSNLTKRKRVVDKIGSKLGGNLELTTWQVIAKTHVNEEEDANSLQYELKDVYKLDKLTNKVN